MRRGKMLLLSGMVVALVAVGVASVVMFKGLSQAAETRRERDRVRERLAAYYRNDPFPSPANVELEKANLETAKTWYRRLLTDLQAANVPANESSPIVFNSRREAITAELVRSAPMGEGGQPVVPANFGFGFDRYAAGDLANPTDVPRLIRQLRMVEILVKEMYAAGVLRIASVAREEFEATAATATGGGDDFVRPRFGDAEPAPTATRDGRVDGPVTMDRQIFTFELVATEDALVELLNRIARLDVFAVVTRLDLAKTGPDFVLPGTAEAADPAGAAGAADAADAAPAVKPMPPTRIARLVSGRDRAAPVKITLDVEVYSFEGEA